MNWIKEAKVTKVVSAKITNEEYIMLQKIAINYQSRGYISKANTSEILRLFVGLWTMKCFPEYKDKWDRLRKDNSKN